MASHHPHYRDNPAIIKEIDPGENSGDLNYLNDDQDNSSAAYDGRVSASDPYLRVYTAAPLAASSPTTPITPGVGIISPGVMSTSSSAYTVDSRCELLQVRGGGGMTEKQQRRQKEHEDEDDDESKWGFGTYRPGFLQPCASIKVFVFHCCVFSTVSGALIAGYVNSVITTIEKRFEIASSHSGLIPASVEFGSLLAVLFVSYFGGSRNIPLWIGFGALLQGLGAITFTLPHFLSQSYTVTGGLISNVTDSNMCQIPGEHSGLGSSFQEDMRRDMCEEERLNGNYIELNIFILIAAQAMIGIGGGPLFTLGTTYIDDHVPKEQAPAYIALLYATGALGPVLGFGLGSLMLQLYVDYFSFDYHRLHLTPDDPRWVGAWWAGFLVCGALLIAASVPFFGFPKVLWKEKLKLAKQKENLESLMKGFVDPHTSNDSSPPPSNYGKDIKDLPRSMWRLLNNPIYMVTCLGICCEVAIVCGFVVFLPKYLETQFGMSKSFANLLTGGIAIPGAVVGILVGGYLCKRCQLAARGALQLTLTLNFLALATCGLFFLLGCDNVTIAGATRPYDNSSGTTASSSSSSYAFYEANLTSLCNMDCDCSPSTLEPVCGINGVTYFSPCHAGCTQLYVADLMDYQNYTGCSCILESLQLGPEVSMTPMARRGVCQQQECATLLPFMCLLFVMTFVVAGTQMPLIMMTLRSVAEEERAFALGIQFVLLRLFAYIPAPIVYGQLIDSACVVWKRRRCGGGSGVCLLYNIEKFRHTYVGLSAALKTLGMLFFLTDWVLVYRNSKQQQQQQQHEVEVGALQQQQPVQQVTCPPGATCAGAMLEGAEATSMLAVHREDTPPHGHGGRQQVESTDV